jgi:hypothetical protein
MNGPSSSPLSPLSLEEVDDVDVFEDEEELLALFRRRKKLLNLVGDLRSELLLPLD